MNHCLKTVTIIFLAVSVGACSNESGLENLSAQAHEKAVADNTPTAPAASFKTIPKAMRGTYISGKKTLAVTATGLSSTDIGKVR